MPCAFQWGKMCNFPGPNYFVQTPEKIFSAHYPYYLDGPSSLKKDGLIKRNSANDPIHWMV